MRKILMLPLLLALAMLGIVSVAGPASAHNGTVSGAAYCNDDGTWGVVWTFNTLNVPNGRQAEVKAMTTSSGSLAKSPGSGVMAGNQVMLSAWYEHRNNWPGVPTRTGNWSDKFSTVNIPGTVNSVTTMVQYDYKDGPSGDPVGKVDKPVDCKTKQPKDDTEYRDRTVTDCQSHTQVKVYEKRSRSYSWTGGKWVAGPWSAWTQYKSEVISTDPEVCRPNQPEPERETRDVTGQPDCEAGTVTSWTEERTRSWSWNSTIKRWVLGAWSEWTKVAGSETSVPANPLECPPCEDDVCDLPVAPGSQGDVICDGALSGGVYDEVTVQPGDTCVLVDVYVNGSVKTDGARSLRLHDVTVRGNVIAKNVSGDVYMGSKQSCRYDPLVGGSVRVVGSHNVLICDMTVCKDIVVKRNDGKITVRNSAAQQRIVVQNNRKFVRDPGDSSHRALAKIRLINLTGQVEVRNNAPRKVVQR